MDVADGHAERVSGLTHLAGALLSVAFTVFLVIEALGLGKRVHAVGFAIFGATAVLLYTASTVYHLVRLPEEQKVRYRRLDHILIFVLIAGTYTPVCLTVLPDAWGIGLLVAVWAFAAFGVLYKFLWLGAPRWLSSVLYIIMGWLVVVAVVPLWASVGISGFLWLLSGGVAYSLGAAIYATGWPTLHRRHFTFHELFHVLVMAGTAAHVWFMQRFVLPS